MVRLKHIQPRVIIQDGKRLPENGTHPIESEEEEKVSPPTKKAKKEPAKKKQVDKIIGLNIGGVVFMTLQSTLTSQFGIFQSLLKDKNALKDADGNFFIDRSPMYFDTILEFYRQVEWRLPKDLNEDAFNSELLYYRLNFQVGPNRSVVYDPFGYMTVLLDPKIEGIYEVWSIGDNDKIFRWKIHEKDVQSPEFKVSEKKFTLQKTELGIYLHCGEDVSVVYAVRLNNETVSPCSFHDSEFKKCPVEDLSLGVSFGRPIKMAPKVNYVDVRVKVIDKQDVINIE